MLMGIEPGSFFPHIEFWKKMKGFNKKLLSGKKTGKDLLETHAKFYFSNILNIFEPFLVFDWFDPHTHRFIDIRTELTSH